MTTPNEDYYDPTSCDLVDDDKDQCYERCVDRALRFPPPMMYGIGPQGTDCQEYARDTNNSCKKECN